MNTYLVNYIKRDAWLENGKNYGLFLREVDRLVKERGLSWKKASKKVKRTLWRIIRKTT